MDIQRSTPAGTNGNETLVYLDGTLVGKVTRTSGAEDADTYLVEAEATGAQSEVFATQAEAEAHLVGLRAHQHRRGEAESFERSEEDGALSQWAHRLSAEEADLQAKITANGDRAEFCALFDTEGNLVPAKEVEGRYGTTWGLLASADPHGEFAAWFNPSKAKDPGRAKARDAYRGYFVGFVLAPARAELTGGDYMSVRAVAVRTDGGYSPDVEVVCNGHGADLTEDLGGIYGREAAWRARHRQNR